MSWQSSPRLREIRIWSLCGKVGGLFGWFILVLSWVFWFGLVFRLFGFWFGLVYLFFVYVGYSPVLCQPYLGFPSQTVDFLWQRPPPLTHVPCSMLQWWGMNNCFVSHNSQAAQSIPGCVWVCGSRPVCVQVKLLLGRHHQTYAFKAPCPMLCGSKCPLVHVVPASAANANVSFASFAGFVIIGWWVKKKINRERLYGSAYGIEDSFTLTRHRRAWYCISGLQEKLWSIITLHRQ